MSTNYWKVDYPSGSDIYIRLWNDSHQVFDFNDSTFKAIASATTPYLECTYSASEQIYRTDSTIDWGDVWNKGTPLNVTVFAYDNATPDDADVPVTEATQVTVQFGELGAADLICGFDACFTSTAGTEVRMLSWLERAGQTIVLASGSCAITVREHGAGGDLFTASDAAPNADGVFEVTQATPGFTPDRVYAVTVAITENGVTWTTTHTVPVFG
jgi:hypothetical protein